MLEIFYMLVCFAMLIAMVMLILFLKFASTIKEFINKALVGGAAIYLFERFKK